jgi:hypothetical protein
MLHHTSSNQQIERIVLLRGSPKRYNAGHGQLTHIRKS